jgi:hypothetical protein
MTRVVGRLVAAVVLTAAAGLAVPGPAQAAACATAHGVTVVVDHHQLGGGVDVRCDLGGGGDDAATQLTDTGFKLTYAQRQPGFVCRVDGAPASDPCVNTSPADAYWSLWWSDGKTGHWSYSTLGAGSLTVPDGGYVAMSWQGGAAKALPRFAPAAHPSDAPTPTRSASPSQAPSTPHTTTPSVASPTSLQPTSQATASATPLRRTAHPSALRARHHHSSTPSPGHATRTTSALPGDPQVPASSSSGGGLPGWVPPVLVVVLFAAAGTVAVVRRRGSGGAG